MKLGGGGGLKPISPLYLAPPQAPLLESGRSRLYVAHYTTVFGTTCLHAIAFYSSLSLETQLLGS
jgi:hypothetical protein